MFVCFWQRIYDIIIYMHVISVLVYAYMLPLRIIKSWLILKYNKIQSRSLNNKMYKLVGLLSYILLWQQWYVIVLQNLLQNNLYYPG